MKNPQKELLSNKKKEEEDQDKEYMIDKKTYEDRAWDNFKDENEKGAGNKMGK